MLPIRQIVLTAALAALAPVALAAQATPAPAGPEVTGSGPNGATLRCRDGSYPASGAADSACDGRGGVLVRFPMRRVRTAPAGPVERAAPVPPASTQARDTTPPAGFVPYSQRQSNGAALRENRAPADATLLCGDGSHIQADTSSARCAGRGGVKLRIAAPLRTQLNPSTRAPRTE